jgi:hypothetical protein
MNDTLAHDTDTIEEFGTVYEMPRHNEAAAINSIEKANRRAERAGVADRFTYTITHSERKRRNQYTGIEFVEERTTLILNRPTVKHDGYEFIATLTWDDEAGMIARIVPGETLAARPDARRCDVCETSRRRVDTYVVRKDGVETQVGSNCLVRFMGIKPAGLWMLAFDLDVTEGSDEDGWGGGFSRGEVRLDTVDLLALGLAVVKDQGWVSRGKAEAWGKAATADVVSNILFVRPTGRDADAVRRWNAEMVATSHTLRGEAATVLDAARNLDGDNDYVLNLRAATTPDTVSTRNMALVLSAIAAHQNRVERAAREAATPVATSKHLGVAKAKITVKGAVTTHRYIDGDYGVRTLIEVTSTDGDVVKWWATGAHDEVEVGDAVEITGTVKAHEEYRGVKCTVILRAKIVKG